MSLHKFFCNTTETGVESYFLLEHVTNLIVLGEGRSLVAIYKFVAGWKKIWNRQCCSTVNKKLYPSTQKMLPWFLPFRLCSNSWQWHFCFYQHATQQNAWWKLDKNCNVLSRNVNCRLFWTWDVQFPQTATVDACANTVPPQCLWFSHNLCSFGSLQVL